MRFDSIHMQYDHLIMLSLFYELLHTEPNIGYKNTQITLCKRWSSEQPRNSGPCLTFYTLSLISHDRIKITIYYLSKLRTTPIKPTFYTNNLTIQFYQQIPFCGSINQTLNLYTFHLHFSSLIDCKRKLSDRWHHYTWEQFPRHAANAIASLHLMELALAPVTR